jgi:hypothetical protein
MIRSHRGKGKKGEAGERRNIKIVSFSAQQSYNQNHAEISFNLLLNTVLFCSVVQHLLYSLARFQEGSFHTFQLIVPIREGFSVMGFYYIGRNYYVNCIPLIMKIEATLKSLYDRME